jgi:hypothetical protein
MTHRILSIVGALLCASFVETAHAAEMITLRYGQNAAGANSLSSLHEKSFALGNQVVQLMDEAGVIPKPVSSAERFIDLRYLKAAGIQ